MSNTSRLLAAAVLAGALALGLGHGGAVAEPAQEVLVSNPAELTQALAAAQPGDTIVLADGTWENAFLDISAATAPGRPVTVRAQTPGKVVLTGRSGLSLNSPDLVVSGLTFTNGTVPAGKGSVITFNSDRGRVTDTAVVDFNPAEPQTPYYWVYFRGGANRFDHSLLEGKNHQEPVVGNDRGLAAKYNKVDHTRFANVPNIGRNGMEALRIWGYGQWGDLGTEEGAYFTIEHNLFEHVDGDDEIISLKSNHNTVRFNTIKQSSGGLVLRYGNYNTVENNVILGERYPASEGIRVSGNSHTVRGNYVAGVSGYGLKVTSGEHLFDENNQLDYLTPGFVPQPNPLAPYGYLFHYGQVTDSEFSGNVFVDNAKSDMHLGWFYKNHWPGYQMVLLPERNTFTGNIAYRPAGGVSVQTSAQDTAPPLEKFTFEPNIFKRNVVIGGTLSVNPPNTSDGIVVVPLARSARPQAPRSATAADTGPSWRE
ncbi:polysaccharide lyase 6 family protein [Nonomuraea sp. NPDC059194]|uniref:polysaccharide lyase 6 family protein n=1 Tax=Nonomuraea sp. NPDC059194 TaxID=3346764 RepID=UPI0036990F38